MTSRVALGVAAVENAPLRSPAGPGKVRVSAGRLATDDVVVPPAAAPVAPVVGGDEVIGEVAVDCDPEILIHTAKIESCDARGKRMLAW